MSLQLLPLSVEHVSESVSAPQGRVALSVSQPDRFSILVSSFGSQSPLLSAVAVGSANASLANVVVKSGFLNTVNEDEDSGEPRRALSEPPSGSSEASVYSRSSKSSNSAQDAAVGESGDSEPTLGDAIESKISDSMDFQASSLMAKFGDDYETATASYEVYLDSIAASSHENKDRAQSSSVSAPPQPEAHPISSGNRGSGRQVQQQQKPKPRIKPVGIEVVTSVGASLHKSMKCKACFFENRFHNLRPGEDFTRCGKGEDCQFCHELHPRMSARTKTTYFKDSL
mmetsp:Transcript_38158/g.69069  ORF Transcript_38158/g.69069 Transcript_38158/m.69069 type:complete len:285 (+) Transcript_38158:3-857(+)